MKQSHLSFLQSKCKCRTRIHSFLSVIYIAPIFHIFKKKTNSLSFPVSISTLFFVDNGPFISQEKSYEKSNTNLFCSYSIISFLFNQFGLVIEHNKSEVFHFSRAIKNTKLSLLNLGLLKELLLWLKDTWEYLDFIFDRKLFFHQHIHLYANKALFTIKSIKMLDNSIRRLSPTYKQLLYRNCVIYITLHGFQL